MAKKYIPTADAPAVVTSTKLDDLTAPDDTTDLDASASKHGLLPKLSGSVSDVLKGDGTWGTVTAGQPEIVQSDNSPASDLTITAGFSAFIDEELVLADGKELILEDGGSMVIL